MPNPVGPPRTSPGVRPATPLERALVVLLLLVLAFAGVILLFPVLLVFAWSANPRSQDGPLPPNWPAAMLALAFGAAVCAGTGACLWMAFRVARRGCARPGPLAWVGGALFLAGALSVVWALV